MRTPDLNLSQRPYINARPVKRLAILLWVLGGILLIANFAQYWRFFSGSEERRAELTEAQLRVSSKEQDIERVKQSIRGFDLVQQNEQVDFLNHKIAERTFSWSHLFDRLSEVLPADVRLNTLSPRAEELGSEFGRSADLAPEDIPGDRVAMNITGEAKTVEAELEFIDHLFGHPSFEQPRLLSDSTKSGITKFSLRVLYFPGRQVDADHFAIASQDTPNEETNASEGEGSPSSQDQTARGSLPPSRERTAGLLAREGTSESLATEDSNDSSAVARIPGSQGSRAAFEPDDEKANERQLQERSRDTTRRSRDSSSRTRSSRSNRRQLTNPQSSGSPQPGLSVGTLPGGLNPGRGSSGNDSQAAPGADSNNPLLRDNNRRRNNNRRRPRRAPEPPTRSGVDQPSDSIDDSGSDPRRPSPRRPSASGPLEIQ